MPLEADDDEFPSEGGPADEFEDWQQDIDMMTLDQLLTLSRVDILTSNETRSPEMTAYINSALKDWVAQLGNEKYLSISRDHLHRTMRARADEKLRREK